MKFGGQPTPWSDEQIDGLRCRTVAQTLIEEIGADGPESAEDAAKRAVAVIQRQRDRIAALEAENAERERELTAVKSVLYDEIDANLAFRDACGESDDEDMPTFCARIVFELRELRTRMADLSSSNADLRVAAAIREGMK